MLYIVRGLPGSGKSTYVKNKKNPVDKHFEADMYFINSMGYYIFDQYRLKQAHEWCQTATHRALIDSFGGIKHDVYVSNTFTTHKEMQPYFDMAVGLAAVEVIHCTGTYGSIHNVPHEAMERMAKRWQPFNGEKTV